MKKKNVQLLTVADVERIVDKRLQHHGLLAALSWPGITASTILGPFGKPKTPLQELEDKLSGRVTDEVERIYRTKADRRSDPKRADRYPAEDPRKNPEPS